MKVLNDSRFAALILTLLLGGMLSGVQPAAAAEEAASDTVEAQAGEMASEEKEEKEEKEAKADESTIDERLDALLAEVSTYESREITRCLNPRSYRSVKVLNTDYLLFYRGQHFWLNKLKRTCPTLKFNDLPVFESRGSSSLCEGDPFFPTNSLDLQRGLDPSGRPRAMYGTCYLGSFEVISAEQAALLMGKQ